MNKSNLPTPIEITNLHLYKKQFDVNAFLLLEDSTGKIFKIDVEDLKKVFKLKTCLTSK